MLQTYRTATYNRMKTMGTAQLTASDETQHQTMMIKMINRSINDIKTEISDLKKQTAEQQKIITADITKQVLDQCKKDLTTSLDEYKEKITQYARARPTNSTHGVLTAAAHNNRHKAHALGSGASDDAAGYVPYHAC